MSHLSITQNESEYGASIVLVVYSLKMYVSYLVVTTSITARVYERKGTPDIGTIQFILLTFFVEVSLSIVCTYSLCLIFS